MDSATNDRGAWRYWFPALCVTLGMATALIRHAPFHLDQHDEAKQAFVSYEIIQGGNLFFQHSPDGELATKPPFCGWVSAAVYVLSGSWPLAWRGTSAIAGALILVVLFKATRPLGPMMPWLAMSVFLLNTFSQRMVFLIRTDAMLALSVLLPVWMVADHLRTETVWSRRACLLYGCLLWVGLMTKGPIQYVFILPGILLFTRLQPGKWRALKAPALWPHLAPFLLFGGWAVAGMVWMPGFLEQVVLNEFGSRFHPGSSAAEGLKYLVYVLYYPAMLLARMLPWSVLLLWCLMAPGLKQRLRSHPEWLWVASATAGALIVMSLVPSKRPDRIYPIIPLLSLLLPALMALTPPKNRVDIGIRRLFPLWMVLGLLLYGGNSIANALQNHARNDGALMAFGRDAQALIQARQLQPAIHKTVAFETGMVLYTDIMAVMTLPEAASSWAAGQLNAFIVDAEHLTQAEAALPGAEGILVSDNPQGRERVHYLLVQSQ